MRYKREPSLGIAGQRLTEAEQNALVEQQMRIYDDLTERARPYAESVLKRILRQCEQRKETITQKRLSHLIDIALDHGRTIAEDVAHAMKADS